MAGYNLFIAYDLISPGQHYPDVEEAIERLGQWHKFQYSLYYVNTSFSPQQAYALVWEAMDPNDKLAVIDARGGVVSTGDQPLIAAINTIWLAT